MIFILMIFISNKTKQLLVEHELEKLQTFDLSIFISQSYFGNDGSQNFVIFQLIYKTLTTFSGLRNTIAE